MSDNVVSLHDYLPVPPLSLEPIRYDDPVVLAKAKRSEEAGRREQARLDRIHREVVDRCTGTLRKVAAMHGPRIYPDLFWSIDTPSCEGCDIDLEARDASSPPWPCSTFEMIEEDVT